MRFCKQGGGALWRSTLLAGLLVLVPFEARAEEVEKHPLRLHGEGGFSMMLTEPHRSRFDNGVNAIGRLGVDVVGPLSVQASVANLWLPAKEGERGRMYTLEGGLRASFSEGNGLVGGPVIDLNAGVGFTGDLRRFVIDPGVGWELVFADWVAGGPMVRYMQVVQPSSDPQPKDGRLFFAGIGLTFSIPVRASVGTGDQDREARDAFAKSAPEPEPFAAREPFEPADVPGEESAAKEPPEVAEVPAAPVAPAPAATSLKERIHFAHGQSQFAGSDNAAALEEVCRQLQERPNVMLRIAGHSDETGDAGYNQILSAQRAASVSRWLMQKCDVPASRLEVTAYGDSRPVCTDGNASCHAKNRRVEFELVER